MLAGESNNMILGNMLEAEISNTDSMASQLNKLLTDPISKCFKRSSLKVSKQKKWFNKACFSLQKELGRVSMPLKGCIDSLSKKLKGALG